jgi:3-phenylpropionate/trans-cinnamate dioxygenase ferredoxin subunit
MSRMVRSRVADASGLPVGGLQRVVVDEVAICLAHAEDGNFYAIGDRCTHEAVSLSGGELWGMEVECPLHASVFDVRTGEVTGAPATVPVQTYPVVVEDGAVYVET